MAEMDVRQHGEPAERQSGGAPTLTPAVDLYEDREGITLTADMPGVSPDGLDVEIRNNELLIEGTVGVDMPEQMTARYAELRGGRYRRSFALSQDVDADNIEASLKLGVLTVKLPKKAAFKPRRITVK